MCGLGRVGEALHPLGPTIRPAVLARGPCHGELLAGLIQPPSEDVKTGARRQGRDGVIRPQAEIPESPSSCERDSRSGSDSPPSWTAIRSSSTRRRSARRRRRSRSATLVALHSESRAAMPAARPRRSPAPSGPMACPHPGRRRSARRPRLRSRRRRHPALDHLARGQLMKVGGLAVGRDPCLDRGLGRQPDRDALESRVAASVARHRSSSWRARHSSGEGTGPPSPAGSMRPTHRTIPGASRGVRGGSPVRGEPGRVGASGFRLDPPVCLLRLSQLGGGPGKPGGVEGGALFAPTHRGLSGVVPGLGGGRSPPPRGTSAPFFASSPGLHLLASLRQETPQLEARCQIVEEGPGLLMARRSTIFRAPSAASRADRACAARAPVRPISGILRPGRPRPLEVGMVGLVDRYRSRSSAACCSACFRASAFA